MQRYLLRIHSDQMSVAEMEKDSAGAYVKHSDAQALIAAKDAEISRLQEELATLNSGIIGLRTRADEDHERAESLQSKCAKMRDLLGECRANLAPQRIEATPCLAYRIDAILESEE